ncbi:MAG: Glu-tRNA(Gln) amidotransferase subunit GatE [Bacteroidales bacterium]|nr:Glu-tRNA(Gln) amidotransferase subunit GatE [Bacteroidales bacterium]
MPKHNSKTKSDPENNYLKSMKEVEYVPRKEATQETYDKIGFMSGLEVHQQLLTEKKLFCHCPAGVYNGNDQFDAEVIRHMRPTLSELGEYDGTALMEFKTRKEIVYRLKNETTCTYEVDDTPPFQIDKTAVDISIQISLMSKLNIVGEVHITRKQYLDGSIPTGFQRTAIIGVEGEIYLKNKKVRLIQLSLEEDSCREVSDIRHTRIFKTDRLGMPLIETVTYPEMVNPDEVMEACNYIRFLNRSSGKVRTGIGAGRQDVNVSCKGGTRVEIKGVSRTKSIPELTHNEAFRQWALLKIRAKLNAAIPDTKSWKMNHKQIDFDLLGDLPEHLKEAHESGYQLFAVQMPGFKGMLSHFTQPGKIFADEICDRLKVVACLEKPNMIHSEEFRQATPNIDLLIPDNIFDRDDTDAQIIFWGPEEDIETALETIEERCKMAFDGVPNETRKSFDDGTTIFERVLPGADRMYPDTDSAPIPLENERIENLRKNLPGEVIDYYHKMREWNIPEDTFIYILRNNLFPLIERITNDLKVNPKFVGTTLGHKLKFIEGHYQSSGNFKYEIIYDLFKFLKEKKLELQLIKPLLTVAWQHPEMEFNIMLDTIKFNKISREKIISKIPILEKEFSEIRISKNSGVETKWIMGHLNKIATGNMALNELSSIIDENRAI